MNKMLDLVCQINEIVDGIKPVKCEVEPIYVGEKHICPMCEGEGFIQEDYVCPNCKGEGYVYTKTCVNEEEIHQHEINKNKINIVNAEIKKAIVNTTERSSGVYHKQVIAILNLYVCITNTKLSLEQLSFLHTITKKQAEVIISSLNRINKVK